MNDSATAELISDLCPIGDRVIAALAFWAFVAGIALGLGLARLWRR